MTLVKWNQPNPNLNHLVGNFFGKDFVHDVFGRDFVSNAVPAVNVKENNENYTVEVAAPGLKKEDFHVELHNNLLTISANVKKENHENTDKYTRREFSYSAFQRTFTLPNHVASDKIDAKYVDGVLHLVLPKKEEAKEKPARKIEIA
ncbi:MAG: Hsp20/alpha crystallin family protein [Verrucomicrobia bacterium]|nr:Hsp20/alpha crystallin family protein [Cytophagales bacterium]